MIRDYTEPRRIRDDSFEHECIEKDIFRESVLEHPTELEDELIPIRTAISFVEVMPRFAYGKNSIGIYAYHNELAVYEAEIPLEDPNCFNFIDWARKKAGQQVLAAMTEPSTL